MMALRRRTPTTQDIWPGFVDALAALLVALIFLLLVFVISQFSLNDALLGRDRALEALNARVSALAEALALEKASSGALAERITALRASVALKDRALDASKADAVALEQRVATLLHELAALEALKSALEQQATDARRAAASTGAHLMAVSDDLIKARAETALLNQHLAALTQQLAALSRLLGESEDREQKAQLEIRSLGERLNTALVHKVEELERYRSEFLGRLRRILGVRSDVQVVKDRFVFQSEVLFASGSAQLEPGGERQLADLARTLLEISAQIPKDIDWILQVEGHTDATPIASERYPSNWELSTARAVSVVKFLRSQGIPAKRLSATGFGEFQPLDPARNDSAYRRNRRIELRLTQR